MLTTQEIAALRVVAQQYADIAALPQQSQKRNLWIKLNTLHMERPMVLIDQIPWSEMDVDGSLVCRVQDPYWGRVEREMRRTIYKWNHLPADMVVNPYVCLPRPIINTGWGITDHADVLRSENYNDVASRHFECQINDMDDVERIKLPQITLDTAAEAKIIETAHEVFDGIIDFKMTGECMHLGIWDRISEWMGVENCYFALIDEPEMIHALMEKLTQGLIGMVHQLNALELFDITSNVTHCSHTFLPDMPKKGDHALSGNAWAFGLAQLFTSASPKVTEEFEVAYMKRVFPYFGAIYYGCCDRLDDRMDIIEKLPHIRKLSCSPWSEREAFAANMPSYCVMSNKPTPAYLANGKLDEELIRSDIRRTIDAAKAHGRNLELILKDLSTIGHNPACLWRWQEIAMEEVCR